MPTHKRRCNSRYITTNRQWHSLRPLSWTFGTLTIPSTRALKRFDLWVHQRYNNWYFIITQLLCWVSATVWPFMATARNLQSEKPFSPGEGNLASGCKKNKYAISGTGNVFLQIAGMTKKKMYEKWNKKNSLSNNNVIYKYNIILLLLWRALLQIPLRVGREMRLRSVLKTKATGKQSFISRSPLSGLWKKIKHR